VAVVIDPIQSVRGKVVIDAFRLINPLMGMSGHEPRQTTSVNGHLNKPSIEAMYKGLNKYYYSININYRTNELEQKMLSNLYKNKWNNSLKLQDQEQTTERSGEALNKVGKWCEEWSKRVEEETKKDRKELAIRNTGKIDPKRHIAETVEETINENILGVLGDMVSTQSF
jgi:26S proteasome regulatory subunit N11